MTFFVISGFLITGILLDQRQRGIGSWKDQLKKFYVRRAFRIFPLYYVVLLFVVAIDLATAVRQDFIWHLLFLNNLSGIFLQGGIGPYGPTFPWWSLAVEEQFYLCWAPLALLAPKKWLPAIIGIAAVSAFGFRLIGWLNDVSAGDLFVFTLGNLDALAAGCAVALLVRSRWALELITANIWRLIGTAATAGFLVLLYWHQSLDLLSFRTSFANVVISDMVWYLLAASTIFFLATGRAAILRALLENRVFVFVGRRSYGIYVLHEVVAHFLAIRYGALIELRTGIKLHLYGPLEAMLFGVVTLSLASLSYKYFELPLLEMRERRPVSAAM